MTLLTIKNGKAYLSIPGENDKALNDIDAEDIAKAMDVILSGENIDVAPEDDSGVINNPATRIIFEKLKSAFEEVLQSREAIVAEIEGVFSEAEAKYLSNDINNRRD